MSSTRISGKWSVLRKGQRELSESDSEELVAAELLSRTGTSWYREGWICELPRPGEGVSGIVWKPLNEYRNTPSP